MILEMIIFTEICLYQCECTNVNIFKFHTDLKQKRQEQAKKTIKATLSHDTESGFSSVKDDRFRRTQFFRLTVNKYE